MNTTPIVALVSFNESGDYRVSSSDTDPRSWSVVDSNNVTVGDVTDLIIDVNGLTTRYIVCAIQRGDARNVLIPVGFARLNPEQSTVHLDFVTFADIEKLPDFTGLPLSADFEADQEKALTGVEPTTNPAKIVRRSS